MAEFQGQRERIQHSESQPQPCPEGGAGSEGRWGSDCSGGGAEFGPAHQLLHLFVAVVIGVSFDQWDGRWPARKAGVAALSANMGSFRALRVPAGGGEGGGGSKMAVAGKGVVSAAVKPIFSRDLGEAKRRVRELYRAWYREVPNTGG